MPDNYGYGDGTINTGGVDGISPYDEYGDGTCSYGNGEGDGGAFTADHAAVPGPDSYGLAP